MKVVALITIFLIGLTIGYIYFSEAPITGQATRIDCEYNNEPCICDEECRCGNYTIRKEECYSNSNL